MELAGLEPAASWVRSGDSFPQTIAICRGCSHTPASLPGFKWPEFAGDSRELRPEKRRCGLNARRIPNASLERSTRRQSESLRGRGSDLCECSLSRIAIARTSSSDLSSCLCTTSTPLKWSRSCCSSEAVAAAASAETAPLARIRSRPHRFWSDWLPQELLARRVAHPALVPGRGPAT
jgi:hypothetical protein